MWFIVSVICLIVLYVSGRRYGRHWFAKWQRYGLPWRREKPRIQLTIDNIESVAEIPDKPEQFDLSVNKQTEVNETALYAMQM